MPGESFRFIHASNFRLERPLAGIAEVPENLCDTLIEAPFASAEAVFQAAIIEEVDFVVLAGDLLDPQEAGPHAVAFLLGQFEQLNERGIDVYWATGRSDAVSRWPGEIHLPENVFVFAIDHPESVTFTRNDRQIARIIGQSFDGNEQIRPAGFRDDGSGLPHIAVAHGRLDSSTVENGTIRYWALGGSQSARTLSNAPATVHYSGGPVGFTVHDSGPHGCTLVQFAREGQVRLRQIDTDTVRWCSEQLILDAGTDLKEIKNQMRRRMKDLSAAGADRPLLVCWKLTTGGTTGISRPFAVDELLTWLRDQFGEASRPAWSVSVEIENQGSLPDELYDEDTILGDFLRAVRRQQETGRAMDVSPYLSGCHVSPEVAELLHVSADASSRVLNEVAVKSVGLLRGEEGVTT